MGDATKKRLHTWHVSERSAEDGELYEGQFTCKKASVLDHTRISRRKAELCGGMYCVRNEQDEPTGVGIDEETEYFNFAVANIEVLVVQKPDWFDLEVFDDGEILMKIYKEVMEFQSIFRRRRRESAEAARPVEGGAGTGSEEHQDANHDVAPPKVVDTEVSAALDA